MTYYNSSDKQFVMNSLHKPIKDALKIHPLFYINYTQVP